MKKVFTNANDVIHLFAQRTQEEARSSNVFFYNNKIYSYGHHYLLAEFITNNKNEDAIMINNTGYSSTTSGHISAVTRQHKQFFVLNTDLTKVLNQLTENAQKLINARKKDLYILPSLFLFEKLNEYIVWTGKKDIKKDPRYKSIVSLMKVFNTGDLQSYIKSEKTRIERDKAKAAKIAAAKLAKDLQLFENYEISRIYGQEQDFLRLAAGGGLVETSQGVKVSIKEAQTLYKMILAKKDIKGFKISNYTVISINGVLKIGCHHINIDSMHKIGSLILTMNS